MQKYYKPSRIAVTFVIMGLLIAVYLTALYKLQIYDTGADENAALAHNTTKQNITLTANRGDILDRNGVILVSTRAAYNIILSLETLPARDDINAQILELIVAAVDHGVDYTDTFPVTAGAPFSYPTDMTTTQKSQLDSYLDDFGWDKTISASDLIIKMKQQYGLDYTTNISDARLIIGVQYELKLRDIISLNPYVFARDVDIDFISMLKERDYPGVTIAISAVRVYHTKYAAHTLGYIGLLSGDEYNDTYKALGYSYSSMVGKVGAELAFEQYLHGTDGTQVITTSKNGTVIDVVTKKDPIPGENVYLSIDIGLQEVCEDSLAAKIDLINSERAEEDRVTGGAVVVTDVNTGEILASGSYPSYDLSTVYQNYTSLSNNSSHPLFNRATQGTYKPGSTFKMVTALAGLKSGKITPSTTVFCTGKYTAYDSYQPVCWIYPITGAGHGLETVVTALRDSCNYFFYWLGDTIGLDAITDTAFDFGFGAKTGIELYELAGLVASREWKIEEIGEDWWTGDTISTAIGQSYSEFTPLQLAKYVSTIANGGIKYPLTILSNIRSSDFTSVVYESALESQGTLDGSEYIRYLQEGMQLVASAPEGTASTIFKDYQVLVAAKTGTVQTGNENATLNNGVFVCYAPADNPEIAITLVVEKGTSGSTIMEIAKDIMDYYFQGKAPITVAQDNTLLP